ncbi:fimbrial biogenesis chaperone [Dyella sp.]|uniref:fimbrial biogenesis chaperone n=1 Tax=Dyella sp. TaxID=1869338 RepID=UPI002ED63020
MTTLLMCASVLPSVQASVIINGTRVIYPAKEAELTVKLDNEGDLPVLVQTWLDRGDEGLAPESVKVPFTMMPPIFRMEPHKGQAVRVTYTHEALPGDKETLFWFNALEIPPKESDSSPENKLQFAIRTRIKFIFRPDGLAGSAEEAYTKLQWTIANGADGKASLKVNNPSPYYVNFAKVGIQVDGRDIFNDGGGMVAPGQSSEFPLQEKASPVLRQAKAVFDVINDYGGIVRREEALVP